MGIPYATREQVMRSLEILQSSYAGSLIDAKIDSASRSIEGQLHRRFYPELRTIRKDWPNPNPAYTWEVDLGDQEFISLSAVTSGGANILSGCLLRRGDDMIEPPYGILQVDLSSASAFAAGTTFQRSLVITGLTGYNDTDTSLAGAVLSGGINSSVTAITLLPSGSIYTPGIGSLILIDTERMLLVDRSMISASATISADISNLQSNNIVATAGASTFAKGEVILIDGERMRINEIAGTNLIVSRSWDGTPLAAHTNGATIFVGRAFTVKRGVLGSMAASHSNSAPAYIHEYPALINELCVAETVVALAQNSGAYARTIGTGNSVREAVGNGLEDLRYNAYTMYGRRHRSAAI